MISVVIPAHNEAVEIVKLLQEFSSFHDLELVVAEDASTDGTPEIVQEFASQNHKVVLTRSSTLAGKGGAIKRGLAVATGLLEVRSFASMHRPKNYVICYIHVRSLFFLYYQLILTH